MSFPQRLKELRSASKLTQEAISNKLNMNRSTYAKYETGENEPDYETLRRFADFFNVSTDYLLGRTDTPSVPMPEPENLPPLLQDLDPELVRKFYEAMNDPLEELFFDDILSASKEEREELIREFLILKKERKNHLKKGDEK